jgi:hypothetical protein
MSPSFLQSGARWHGPLAPPSAAGPTLSSTRRIFHRFSVLVVHTQALRSNGGYPHRLDDVLQPDLLLPLRVGDRLRDAAVISEVQGVRRFGSVVAFRTGPWDPVHAYHAGNAGHI